MKKETRKLWLEGLALDMANRSNMVLKEECIHSYKSDGLSVEYTFNSEDNGYQLVLADNKGNSIMLLIVGDTSNSSIDDIRIISSGNGSSFAELGNRFLESAKDFGLSDVVLRGLRYKVKSNEGI